jgi:hypothetical protein
MICSPRDNLPHFDKVYSAAAVKRQITRGTLQFLIEQVEDRIDMSDTALAVTDFFKNPQSKNLLSAFIRGFLFIFLTSSTRNLKPGTIFYSSYAPSGG